MGDKSPKSKQRAEKQKAVVKQDHVSSAKAKQDKQGQPPSALKGKK